MEVREIIEFLNSKEGYKKEGAKRLANKVLKGKASIEDCKEALSFARANKWIDDINIADIDPYKDNEKINSNLKLKSRWQGANGKWLESYVNTEEESNILTQDDIEDAVYKALTNVKPVKRKFFPNDSNKSMLVWTSDKHIGADTTGAQHDVPYNRNVFIERMHKLATQIHIKSNQCKGLDTLVIADLGDATDGQDGYTSSRSHKLPQNMTNREVFETYMEVHIAFVDYVILNDLADNYEFWFNTNSNHGGSYEFACHKALQIYINTKYPFVKVKSFDKFLGHTEFKKVTYILTHGKDDNNRKFGLPLYPDPKTEVFIDNYLKVNKLSFNTNIRLIKGDLHQAASVPCKNINRYRNVASLFGSSGWVMDNFGLTPAGTCYEIIDEETNEILEGTFWYN